MNLPHLQLIQIRLNKISLQYSNGRKRDNIQRYCMYYLSKNALNTAYSRMPLGVSIIWWYAGPYLTLNRPQVSIPLTSAFILYLTIVEINQSGVPSLIGALKQLQCHGHSRCFFVAEKFAAVF